MKWFIYVIFEILFTLICYITNPIILLFADEVGELPKCLSWWANWDDHLDVDWMVYEHHVPKWAEYDFNKHYKYYSEWDAEHTIGVHKGYVELLDPNFTLKERFQRYVCRLVWLYRNTGYGFSYEVLGIDANGDDIIRTQDVTKPGYQFKVFYVHNFDYWMIYYFHKWSEKFAWKIFLGWKIQSVKPGEIQRCMLAFCITPFKTLK